MDINSLAAAHIHAGDRPTRMTARAEDRYYASQIVPRLRPGLVGAMVTMASVILILGTSLI